jgi:EAL domain-containing protein (putative c-di-GMP-specific phosphodiesterase class I)
VAYIDRRPEDAERAHLHPSTDWGATITRAISEPGSIRPAFQPIVDLRRGVVCGYEMLSRFAGPPEVAPNVWFQEAGRLGLRVELEAKALEVGLDSRDALPPGCFLTINVDPAALGEPLIETAWRRAGSLRNLVVELTEDSRADDDRVRFHLAELRERGAMIAIDDVGTGYSGLHRISHQRPEFIKVDRHLVAGLRHDTANREMVESLGAVANRLDSFLIAEGIEETEDLEMLMRIGVPYGQGYCLARPQRGMIGPELPLSEWIRAHATRQVPLHGHEGRRLWTNLAPLLLERWEVDAEIRLRSEPDVAYLPVVTAEGRPVGLVARETFYRGEIRLVPPLCALAGEHPAHLAKRAMARPPESRNDPILCCDEQGLYLGPISLEALVGALADDMLARESD